MTPPPTELVNNPIQDIVVKVFAVLGAVATLAAIYKDIVSPIINAYLIRKSKFDIKGVWKSSWEPKAVGEPRWISEEVTISQSLLGRVTITNNDNLLGYQFKCRGIFKKKGDNRYLMGTWDSNDTGDNKSGLFLLMVLPTGILIGIFMGPNTQSVQSAGGWVLGKKHSHIESAKIQFTKGYLSEKDIKYVKSLLP